MEFIAETVRYAFLIGLGIVLLWTALGLLALIPAFILEALIKAGLVRSPLRPQRPSKRSLQSR